MKRINLIAILMICTYFAQAQETLQTVTDRGNVATNSLQIGGHSVNANTTKLFINNPYGKNWALSSGANMITENGFHIYNWTDKPNAPLFTLTNEGKLGIGTFSPTATLDVNGSGNFAGNITAPTFNGNLTGNAATATSSVQWNGLARGNEILDTGYPIQGFYSEISGTAYRVAKGGMLEYLGLPSGGETLQRVTDRGQITNKVIQVTGSDVISSLGKGLTFNFAPSLNAGAIGAYDYPNATPLSLILQSNGGNVGIGTPTPREKLSVNGKIRAHEIKVEAAPWPDYVFAKDYKLPSLAETEKEIEEKGHLPGIPSAEEVKANGINLGEMNAKLLQKIEELTLHLIEMKKESSQDKINIKELKALTDLLFLEINKMKSKI